MPQDIFNFCAASAASCIDHQSVNIEDFAKLISNDYRQRFIDDGFEEDIIIAAHNLVKMMETQFPARRLG